MTKSTIESDHIRRGIGISWDSTRMGGEAGTPITATRWRNLAPAERERLVNFFKTHAQEMSSPTDDWVECAFEDIQKGDTIKYETPDTLIEPKHPVFRNFGDELVFVGDMKVWNHPDAKWYRIPAPVVHPDPAQHPVIIVRESTVLPKGSEPQKVMFIRPYYRNDIWNGAPDTITDWSPAKVVADDDS